MEYLDHDLVMGFLEEAKRKYQDEKDRGRELIRLIHEEAVRRNGYRPLPPLEPATISYTELPEAKPDDTLYLEWNCYRREASRLLAEGQEGRWPLIKGETIIGIWDTREEAKTVALEQFPMQPCLIHQIRSREPLLRGPSRFWRFTRPTG